jgi:hypothetical protein
MFILQQKRKNVTKDETGNILHILEYDNYGQSYYSYCGQYPCHS